MACNLVKEQLKEQIKTSLLGLSSKYNESIEDGKTLNIKSVGDKLFSIEDDLKNLELIYGNNSIYTITESLKNDLIINIEINVDNIAEIVENKINNEEVPDGNYDSASYFNLRLNALKNHFDENQQKLNDYLVNAKVVLGKITQITNIKNIVDEAIKDREVLKELQEIRNQLVVEMGDENFETKLTAFNTYIGEVNTLSRQIFNIAQELIDNNDPNAFIKLNQLNALLRGHYPVIKELYTNLSKPGITNELTSSLQDTLSNMDLLESRTIDSAMNHVELLFTDLNSDTVNQMKLNTQEEIERLSEFKEKNKNNEAIVKKINAQLEKLEKRLIEFSPTRENIKSILRGEKGDIGFFSTWFRSAITNPDVVIASLLENYSRTLTEVRDEMIGIKNEFQSAKDLYLQENNLKDPVNPEKFYSKFVRTVSESYYDHDEKVIKDDRLSKRLVTEVDVQFYADRSKLQVEFTSADIAQKQAYNNWKDDIGTEEDYKKALINFELAKDNLYKWKRDNLSAKYTDAYYAPDKKYLDKYIYQNENGDFVTSDTFVEGSIHLGDTYRKYNKELNDVARQLRSDLSNDILRKRKKELIGLKTDLRNPQKWQEGTIEHAMSNIFLNYFSEKKLMTENVVTEARYNQFLKAKQTKQKQLKEGRITIEEYNGWLLDNTKREFAQEYFDKSNTLTAKMDIIRKRIIAETGADVKKGELKKKWDEINATVNKYRDNNGIINGSEVVEEDVNIIRNLELDIQQLRNIADSLSGLTAEAKEQLGELYNERNKLFEENEKYYKEFKELTTRFNSDRKNKFLKDKIDELKQKLKENKGKRSNLKSVIAAIKDNLELSETTQQDIARLKKLQEEKGDLSHAIKTDYYLEEYDKQFNIFMSEKGYAELPKEFNYDNDIYKYNEVDNNYYRNGVTVDDPLFYFKLSIENQFKSESQWYQNHHILKDLYKEVKELDSKGNIRTIKRMVPTMVPIHIWYDYVPKNEKYILEGRPSFAWSEYKVKDSYVDPETGNKIQLVNNNYKEDIKGNPLPKEGKYINEEYNNLSDSDKKFLGFMREQYYKFQEVYPMQKRMGDIIPSIERDLSIFETTNDTWNKETTLKQLKRIWITNEQDKDTDLGDISGNIAQFLPVYFSSNIDADVVSTNIFTTILKYGQASTQYTKISENVLPTFEAVEQVVANNKIKTNKKDAFLNSVVKNLPDSIANQLGVQRLLGSKDSSNNRLRMVQELKAMLVYGEEQVATKELGNSGIRLDKVFNNLLGFSSLKTMATIPLSPISITREMGNAGGAFVQQLIKTGAKRSRLYLDPKELLKSYKEITSTYSKDMLSDWGKVGNKSYFGQITDLFGVYHENMRNVTGEEIKEASAVRKASGNMFFFLKNGVEITLASSIFLTLAKKHYIKQRVNGNLELIKDENGNPVNVLNAFEIVNGKIEKKYDTWDDSDFNKFRNSFNKINRDTNGAYKASEKSLIQRHWFGTALFWMKKWLIPMAENLYGERRFSYEEGRDIAGSWVVGVPAMISWINMVRKDPRNFNIIHNSLTIEEQDALQQMSIQISILTALAALVSIGFGYDEDDPDRFKKMKKREPYVNWLLYGFLRAQTEVETLVLPWGFDEIRRIKNGGMNQFIPLYDETLKLLDDINLVGEGPVLKRYKNKSATHDKGDIKFWIDLQKLIGLTSAKKVITPNQNKEAPVGAIKGLEFSKNK